MGTSETWTGVKIFEFRRKRRQLYPIQLDIAEVETALFNVKIASDLAAKF